MRFAHPFRNFTAARPYEWRTQEVVTRVSPGSNTIEIMSRPRLSQAAWTLNCRCKIRPGATAESIKVPTLSPTGEILSRADLYDIADSCGLHYGPAFRLGQGVAFHEGGEITLNLAPQEEATGFCLDPMRHDATIQGVIGWFPELHAAERGVAYVPVRLDETTLFVPHGIPQSIIIKPLSKTDRTIVADCFILDAAGALIALAARRTLAGHSGAAGQTALTPPR